MNRKLSTMEEYWWRIGLLGAVGEISLDRVEIEAVKNE